MNPTSSTTKRAGLGRRLLRAGLAAVVGAGVTAGLATGCLNRKVSPAEPNTTNVFVTQITVSAVDKIDLLFVIDNSISMADKQDILRDAVPEMLTRLLQPYCEDAEGNLTPSSNGACPANMVEEFQPVENLHVGVVSSSLGGHGGIACTAAEGSSFVPAKDDRGQLIAPLRGVTSFNNLGFLAWDDRSPDVRVPNTTNDLPTLIDEFRAIVTATGESGCGYEAPLESWYRFLVDPMPPTEVVSDGAASVAGGFNDVLLAQRAQFLRPDSLVAIVVLTDENDCSVSDSGPGFYVAAPPSSSNFKMPRGTQICATEPNHDCCRSCALREDSPPPGCSALSADPVCQLGRDDTEHANLRCYEQKRRFGIDFLYPTDRYVQALTNNVVYGRACGVDGDCPPSPQQLGGGRCVEGGGARFCQYANPLMSGNAVYPELVARSDGSLIFFAGIVGVPWQDIATPETLADPDELEFLPATTAVDGALSLKDRWDTILGGPNTAGGYPLDPFMWESITPRTGVHAISGLPFPEANPITGDRPLDVNSAGAASPINGHEYDVVDNGDLQYACTFRLGERKECTDAITGGCDCKESDSNLATKPLCQDAGQPGTGITQYYAKGYPGLRFLSVLRDFGLNSIVGSVCPKITDDKNKPGYGYNPSVRAIINRLKEKLKGTCLPRRLSVNEDGTVACQVVEITNSQFRVSCATEGRTELDPEIKEAVLAEFKKADKCDSVGQPPCSSFTLCKLTETVDQGRQECLEFPDQQLTGAGAGYCYIDAMQDRDGNGTPECRLDPDNPSFRHDDCIGNPLLVDSCPDSQRRMLRFVSPNNVETKVPFDNSVLFVACQGADLG